MFKDTKAFSGFSVNDIAKAQEQMNLRIATKGYRKF